MIEGADPTLAAARYAARFVENLRAVRNVPGAWVFDEQVSLWPGVRWWRSTTLDLVRTLDGGAWLMFPTGVFKSPPIAANAYGAAPETIIEDLASAGGAVLPAALPIARDLELRLVASRRAG